MAPRCKHLSLRAGSSTASADSAKANLASTFVNALVNAGFGTDKLLLVEKGHEWLYKNKDRGMFSAAASLGLLRGWLPARSR